MTWSFTWTLTLEPETGSTAEAETLATAIELFLESREVF